MERGGRTVMAAKSRSDLRGRMGRLAGSALLAGFGAGVVAAAAQPQPPQPPPAEFQGAIRQLAAGMTEDAGRIAQLRVALGQAEAQRDAALGRIRELEAGREQAGQRRAVQPEPAEPPSAR